MTQSAKDYGDNVKLSRRATDWVAKPPTMFPVGFNDWLGQGLHFVQCQGLTPFSARPQLQLRPYAVP